MNHITFDWNLVFTGTIASNADPFWQVEAENQKMKSLAGVSGEREGYFDDSDQEAAEFGPRVVAQLRDEVDMLQKEVNCVVIVFWWLLGVLGVFICSEIAPCHV